jgi:uncharacterized membrane protein HdeD (DUF308 family)
MSSLVVAAVPDKAVKELWWVGVVEAFLALFFGISAVFWPGLTLAALVYLFSAFVIVLGVTQLIAGLMSIKRRDSWWVTALLGALGLGVGVYLVRHPGISFTAFILIIGLLLIARGLLDLARVFTDRAGSENKALSAIIGVAGVVAGILILLQPAAGGVAFVWILGLYALILGVLGMVVSLELRNALSEPVREDVLEPAATAAETDEREKPASGHGHGHGRRAGPKPA